MIIEENYIIKNVFLLLEYLFLCLLVIGIVEILWWNDICILKKNDLIV